MVARHFHRPSPSSLSRLHPSKALELLSLSSLHSHKKAVSFIQGFRSHALWTPRSRSNGQLKNRSNPSPKILKAITLIPISPSRAFHRDPTLISELLKDPG
ncbi:hypothetical protein AMTR_s00129p00079230 [Amborella trichopoda]|uniref:Uncharacterized protein n=1 Tax=Amborella trichopoda TaxID=13333 RepID=W1NLA8_AMBTC|nr:hypothetical protein AMTR_s00129p00079230 [Amborella trichopoda]